MYECCGGFEAVLELVTGRRPASLADDHFGVMGTEGQVPTGRVQLALLGKCVGY